MMMTRRPGFTVAELLVVVVITAVVLGAVVRSLVVQQRAYSATSELVRGQEGLRIALGVLEAELREATSAGATIGAPDLLMAARDSIRFRAQRKLGFVCSRSGNNVTTWSVREAERFAAADDVFLIYRRGDPNDVDRWIATRPGSVVANSASCPSNPTTGQSHNNLQSLSFLDGSAVDGATMDYVLPGAPVRVVQQVTYGLRQMNGEWVLGRRNADGSVDAIAGGLDEQGVGLRFTYFDDMGNQLSGDPVTAANVASIEVRARTAPSPGSGANPVTLSTHIFLRNN